jgi:hypothetical protein
MYIDKLLFFLLSRSCSHFLIHDRILARITRRVQLMDQDLLTITEHLSSCPFLWCLCCWIFMPVFVVFVLLNHKFSVCCFVDHCLFFWQLYCLSFLDLRLLITPFKLFLSGYSLSFCLFCFLSYTIKDIWINSMTPTPLKNQYNMVTYRGMSK